MNLAQQRAVAVQDQLIALGVDEHNIQVQSFGADLASSELGELIQYPRDRKVSIEFIENLNDDSTEDMAMQF
jgi:outer membrane protein OmpA-like peptidoglycan-associated protein